MLSVGLTGGIACGKSRVLAGFARKGLRTLDLDRLAHRLMAPGGAAHRPVVAAFGNEITDAAGRVDRGRLGAIVFADATQRARLNSIVHPLVREEEGRLRRAAGPDDVFVTDGALLVEAGFHLRFDRLVVVHAPAAIQLARLVRRDGIDEESARQRIASQMSSAEKRGFAHFEIETSGRTTETDRATDALADHLIGLARTPRRRLELPWRRTAAFLTHGPREGPGGLAPARWLAEMTADEEPDLARLAGMVDPAAKSWYGAGRELEPGPETLAGPTALWALAHAGADLEFVAAACYTMARVTHSAPPRLAGACLLGLGLAAVADRGLDRERTEALVAEAARWGGEPPEPRIAAALTAGVRRATRTAPESASLSGADPALTAGIAGFLAGGTGGSAEVEQAARALEAYGRRRLSG